MQFPNGVNKSNLIKLGVLAGAYYLMKGRNNQQTIQAKNQELQQRQDQLDNNQEKLDNNERLTPFQLGKALADKFLGRKS